LVDYDVAICGAGVGGLTLAASLGRSGRRVLLLEKQRGFRMVHKGELIQPRSLDILDALGLLAPLRTAGALDVSALVCRAVSGGELVSLDYGLINARYKHGMVLTYQDMLDTLAAQLGPTVDFQRGTRAEGLLRDDSGRINGVSVSGDGGPARFTANLTVACDGYKSRLRDAAGIRIESHRYDHQLVGFELENAPILDDRMSAYLTPTGLRALFALPGGRARLYVQIPDGGLREIGRNGLPQWAERVIEGLPALEPVAEQLRKSLETVQVQSASRFVAPRWTLPGFALLGDAAHCVHPMVGQGMNAAIRDAWELGRALNEADPFEPVPVDAALLRYEANRRPALEFVSRMSHNLATLLTGTSWPSRTLRPAILRRNRANIPLRRHITQNVAGLTAAPLSAVQWISAAGLPIGRSSADSPQEALR
jgi:2-polyprenyl-6-methoxyphenol hydroxylase-like FAD-dependent oxidoreductase